MSKRKSWKCDFIGCSEIAQWYRMLKGIPVKLCTHHYARLSREQLGKPVEYSQFDKESILLLEKKDDAVYFQCPSCELERSIPLKTVVMNHASFLCPICKNAMLQV